MKETSKRISELVHFHQKVKDMMTEYDEIYNKTIKFHHIKKEVSIILKKYTFFPLQLNSFGACHL